MVVDANLHIIVSEPLSTLPLLAKFPQEEKGPGKTERGDGSRLMINPGQGGLPTLSASIMVVLARQCYVHSVKIYHVLSPHRGAISLSASEP